MADFEPTADYGDDDDNIHVEQRHPPISQYGGQDHFLPPSQPSHHIEDYNVNNNQRDSRLWSRQNWPQQNWPQQNWPQQDWPQQNWAFDNVAYAGDNDPSGHDDHLHYQKNELRKRTSDPLDHKRRQSSSRRHSAPNNNIDGIEEWLPSKLTRRRSRSRRKSVVETKIEDLQELNLHDQAELYRSNLKQAQITGGDELDHIKYKGTKAYRSLRVTTRNALSNLEIWGSSFKEIEGHFGTGVLQFFRFVKIIFHLNVWISLIMFLCLCIPQLVLAPGTFLESTTNLTGTEVTPAPLTQFSNVTGNASSALAQTSLVDFVKTAEKCTKEYAIKVEEDINKTSNSINVLVDFLQGTGWMERTVLFYGFYFNKTFYSEVEKEQTVFNMPLAFLLCAGAYFLASLVIMLNSMASGLTESITSRNDSNVNFCNKVLCGWDYTLNDGSMANLKKKNLKIEFESDLAEEQRKLERKNRTASDKARLYTVRFFINLLVVTVLGLSFALIWFVTDQQNKLLAINNDEFVVLLIQFMPSLTITALYFILPIGFGFLVQYEKYSPEFEIEISLVRIVFVRLASLGVLVVTAYIQIGDKCKEGRPKVCGNCREDGIWCWETYIGQQVYKLVILDFLVHVGVTIIEFIRKAVVSRWYHVKLFKLIDLQEFELPVNVLDIVYTQTLCWFGSFFSPLIPLITLVKVILIFYMKKYSLLINQKPSRRPYKASSSYLFFLVILLTAFAMTAVPIGWAVGRFNPSKSCGPFRIYSETEFFMFLTVTNTVNSWPMVPKAIFSTIGSAAVYIPITVILILLIFYYSAVASGHNKMVKLLEAQLGLEGKDKQFLLARVNNALVQKGKMAH